MLFWFGFTLMVLNEGFVIMRHVHPWFAKKREELIERLGKTWKRIHATLDWAWIFGILGGIIMDMENWKLYLYSLAAFWSFVLIFVYLPMLAERPAKKYKKIKK